MVRKDPSRRGWQQLFDILNQARAYNYLKTLGCSNILFIPRADNQALRTPDIEAILGSDRVLCEVKTINISQKEIHARTSFTVRSIGVRWTRVRNLLFRRSLGTPRIRCRPMTRQAQHDTMCTSIPALMYFLAECKEAYFQQIDQYLSGNPIPGVELIFHNDHTAFFTPLRMTNATVVNDGEEVSGPVR